jgi:hypothetical protein
LIVYAVPAGHSGCLVDMAVFQFILSLSAECKIQVDYFQENYRHTDSRAALRRFDKPVKGASDGRQKLLPID